MTVSIVMGMMLVGLMAVQSSEAEDTIIVAPNPSDGDYTTIQSAIDAAQPGDIILVLAGTYAESVIVDKPLSIVGDDVDAVIIDGMAAESVVTISSSWVNLTDLSITNSISAGSGVMAYGVSHLNLSGNQITHVGNGLLMVEVENSTIRSNAVHNAQLDGARVQDGENNTFDMNLFSGSTGYGLNLSSNGNMVHHNNFIDNGARDNGSNNWNYSYPDGGNYWSDHSTIDGMGGPDQDISQSDGIVDVPYSNISMGISVDHYPLVATWPFADIYPPVIGVDSPANGTVIDPGEPVLFDVWEMNLNSVWYVLDGVDMGAIEEPYSINTSSWVVGDHILLISANDTFDNERNLSLSYTVEAEDFLVIESTPQDLAIDVPVDATISFQFSASVDASTVEGNFSLSPSFGQEWSLSSNQTVLEIVPSTELSEGTTYNITLLPGILSLDGVNLEQTSISFTTVPTIELEVEGRLLDVNGDPVGGAQVLFNDTMGAVTGTETGGDGVFNLTLSPGEYNMTALMASEVIYGMDISIEPPGPIDFGDLDTMWDPGPIGNGTVIGRLLDVNGDPVEGAEVIFETGGKETSNTTGTDGRFEVEIPYGQYNITARMEEETILQNETVVDFPGPIDLGDLETMWDPGPIGNGTVIGRLLDVNGDPIVGAEVIFETGGEETSNTTGADGRFELELPYGQYNITARMEGDTILQNETAVDARGPIDLGDMDTMWDPGPLQPFDPTLAIIILIILIILGGAGYIWLRRRSKPGKPETEERPPPVEIEAMRPGQEPELKPPVISSYGGTEQPAPTPPVTEESGKGRPCREIIRSASSPAELDAATGEAEEADRSVEEARRALEEAEAGAREATERVGRAREELEEARTRYEREVVEPRQRAQEAEERVRDIERRLQDMRDNIPVGHGISFEPRPGWVEGGIGLGDMLKPISIWYRDRETMNEHTDRLRDIYYDEYKPLKEELERARTAAEEARRAAEETERLAGQMENSIQNLEGRLEAAEREAEEAERSVEEARRALEEAEAGAGEAHEGVDRAREGAESEREDARHCEECLQDVTDLLAQIAALRERYEELKAGGAIEEARGRLEDIDGQGVWNDWWDSFRRFRDKVKQMAEIKGLTDAQLPSEFSGIWDWGGPVGTAVGYGAEGAAGAVIPTDTIAAVGELYRVFQALFDPNTALGARILMEQLGADDAPRAADAFNDFPDVLRTAIRSFEKLEELKDLESEISSLLDGWRRCLDALPPVPDMPVVDMDALCLEQCRDKREGLEELKRRLEELIERAEECEPDGLEEKFDRADELKRYLRGMRTRMDRTREGLELYRRAHRQHFSSRGCFISTAAFGSPLAPELDTLRWFRDDVMSKSIIGRGMVRAYSIHSPAIAERLSDMEEARRKVIGYVQIALGIVERRRNAHGINRGFLSIIAVLAYVYGCFRAWQMTRMR